jgi:hypothetical protein
MIVGRSFRSVACIVCLERLGNESFVRINRSMMWLPRMLWMSVEIPELPK